MMRLQTDKPLGNSDMMAASHNTLVYFDLSKDIIAFSVLIAVFVMSLLFARWHDNKKNYTNKLIKTEQKNIKKKRTNRLRLFFTDIRLYKLFVILQVAFVSILILYDFSNGRWNLFFDNNFNIKSSLVKWYGHNLFGNYLALGTLILPLFISKSIDWILSDKKK